VHRYFVTGTDTDVGKTLAAAALGSALAARGQVPTIVKIVQTGLPPSEPGDAARAGRLARAPFRELARFEKPAAPWSAAVAAGRPPLCAQQLARAIDAIPGAVVAEGSGGMMVPLGPAEHLGMVARLARLDVVIVVGLRLGCLNHAFLTLELCQHLGVRVAGAVLCERWQPSEQEYRADVVRVLQDSLPVLGILPFAPDEAAAVEAGARVFERMLNETRR
jgi:dethiobiotin synthetase